MMYLHKGMRCLEQIAHTQPARLDLIRSSDGKLFSCFTVLGCDAYLFVVHCFVINEQTQVPEKPAVQAQTTEMLVIGKSLVS